MVVEGAEKEGGGSGDLWGKKPSRFVCLRHLESMHDAIRWIEEGSDRFAVLRFVSAKNVCVHHLIWV